MPLFRKGSQEEPLPLTSQAGAVLRPTKLTQELLDWAIAALEVVLATPEVRSVAFGREETTLRDALKRLDRLYPLTVEVPTESEPVKVGPIPLDRDRPMPTPKDPRDLGPLGDGDWKVT